MGSCGNKITQLTHEVKQHGIKDVQDNFEQGFNAKAMYFKMTVSTKIYTL